MHKVLTSIKTLENGHNKLHLIVIGQFDLGLGFELWPLCALDEDVFQHYVFDFERCPVIRDSGLGWLLMFARRAEKKGRTVEIVNWQGEPAMRWTAMRTRPATVTQIASSRRNVRSSGTPALAASLS